MSGGPFAGVRVLELSIPYAAAYCGMHLADLGAEVIRVEPPEGAPERHEGAVAPNHSKLSQWLHRGKRSVIVDLDRPQGRDVVRRLAPAIDVLLTNLSPTRLVALGLDYDRLAALNARLVYAQVTGFGDEGPLAGRPGTDAVAQAYAGMLAGNGKLEDDGAPGLPRLIAAELPGGIELTTGIAAALYRRERTGHGDRVELSLLRTGMSINYFATLRDPVADAYNRDVLVAARQQARAQGGSYAQVLNARGSVGALLGSNIYWGGYRAQDGGVVFGALTPANRQAFMKALGITDDPTMQPGYDPFDTENNAKRNLAIKDRVRKQLLEKPVHEWIEIFDAVGAPASPVMFPEDLDDDEQAQLHIVEVEHTATGRQRQVAPLAEFSASPSRVAHGSPEPGQDTADVLASIGGLPPQEIDALRGSGVVR